MINTAIVRKPGKNFADGLTTSSLGAPEYEKMLEQHASYVQTLESLGVQVDCLEPLTKFPDAHFVEDTAVVTPEVAVITNPGAESRNGEKTSIVPALGKYRNLAYIHGPGTVDGGDVFHVGSQFYIGISERTNAEGAEQLGRILESHDKQCIPIPVGAGLHLKSSVNYVGKNTLLITQALADHEAFGSYEKIVLDTEEEYAGNTLLVNDTLLMPEGFPKTYEALQGLGMEIIELNMSEVEKMDGGLTCLSLRFSS